MVHRHVLLFYEVGKGGGGILIHEKEGIVLNQCWIMQRMNKNIKRSRWHLTKMILSLGAAYEHCTYWTYGLMTCTNNPRYDFTCYRCIFNGAVHHQRSAKEVWLTVFPCLLTALIRIPLNVMFERAQVWFLLFTYPREHAWLQFSLLKLKWRKTCNIFFIVICNTGARL